jgi:uncharacterized protein
MTSQGKITVLSGQLYYHLFLSGANKILENQKDLNKINVFPVPDADTGTNLASTFRSIIDNAIPDHSFKTTAGAIAIAALNGARGNSGVIFAQFLYGVSVESQHSEEHSIDSFAEVIKRSVSYIYEAVSEPVEGTMLTVIREWAEFIYSQKGKIDDFKYLFKNSYEIAIQSLKETPEKLAALKLANVVDAGAKGFVLFLEGIIEGILKTIQDAEIIKHLPSVEASNLELPPHGIINFRYCTEGIIKSEFIDKAKLRKVAEKYGDSLVVAGSEKMARIHIHTNNPQDLFQDLRNFGSLTYQKADDMVKQHEIATARKWKIAVVSDTTCDLPQELIDHYQIQLIPLNIHFGENHYLDKLTIRPDQFFRMVETEKEFPSTSQPNEATFTNLYSHLASHYDSIIALHLSGKFSGTLSNSLKAAKRISEETGKKISVLNSKNVSGSLGLLALRVAEAVSEGLTHEEITAQFDSWIEKTKILVSVKNLKNMVRGGRVTPMKGFIANLLNVKPIVSMDLEGGSTLFDKAFSQKGNMEKVMKHARVFLEGRKIKKYIVLHAEAEETAKWFADKMRKLTGEEPLSLVNISPVIGLSAGIGTVALAIMAE